MKLKLYHLYYDGNYEDYFSDEDKETDNYY